MAKKMGPVENNNEISEKYKIDSCMKFNIKLIRNVGCWPKLRKLTDPSEFRYFLYCVLMLGSQLIFICEQVYGMVLYSQKWESVSAALEDIFVLLSTSVVAFKLLTLISHQEKLESLIDRINNHWNVKYVVNEEDKQIVLKGIRHEKKLTLIASVISNGIAVSYLFLSVVQIYKRVRDSGSDFLGLQNGTVSVGHFNRNILIVKYPFKIWNMLEYVLTYIHILTTLVTTTQGTICVDCITWCLLYYICQHMVILIKKVKEDSNQSLERQKKLVKERVEHHWELIRCVHDIQSIFGPVLLLQFTLTSSMICLGVFQMTQIRSMSLALYMKNVFYVIWKFAQLFVFCWYGQNLTNQSTQITSAIYSTKWYTYPGKQNNKLIMMVRGQRPLTLTAAGVFSVSLATFMTVLQSAYSGFALLYTVTHKK